MLKGLLFTTMVAFIFAGCAHKKTSDQQNLSADSALSSENIAYDPAGSDSGKIDGLSSVQFAFDKSSMDKTAKDILTKNAAWIKAHKDAVVQIEGHCDIRGTTEYNLGLGERRAKMAYDYLVQLGVSPKQITTISYGKEKPLTTDESDEAQAKNRRDNFVPSEAK